MISTAQNTFYLLVAYTYQKVVALFYFIFLARYLGADSFGKYTFAISFTTLFAVLIDFGLFAVLTREVARRPEKTRSYFGNVLSFNIIGTLLVFLGTFLAINLLGYSHLTKQLVYLNLLVVFFDALALCIYHVFRGHLNLKFESLGIVIHKTVMLGVGLFLIYRQASLLWVVLPLIAGSFFYFLNALFFFRKKLHFWPWPRLDWPVLKSLLILAWPFFVTAIFAKIFATSDTIILSWFSADKFVGWYSAAQKLILAFLLLVAGSLSTALYPSFSYYFVRSRSRLEKLFNQSLIYLMLLAVPLTGGLIVLARPIILFIYGADYLAAAPALIILACSLPLMFLDYVLSGFLNACEKQKSNTLIHGLGATLFLVLNFLLVPLFFHLGSSLAVLISFLFLLSLEIAKTRKIVALDYRYLFRKIGLIFLATLLMVGVLILIKDLAPVFLVVPVGGLIYLGVSYLTGLISQQEIVFLFKMIKVKKRKNEL
ncbi:flippase [Patescibacteria group bacterium]|nr:flippase [Patescibacteria group bacterium]